MNKRHCSYYYLNWLTLTWCVFEGYIKMPLYWSNNRGLLTSFILLLKSHWVRISNVSSDFIAK